LERAASLTPCARLRLTVFSGFMVNAWAVASIVAIVAGAVGFFVVLRGSAFVTHAIPNGAFAGAAGAVLIGADTIVGLGCSRC
jgi:zinc/manganese transport system permease protein